VPQGRTAVVSRPFQDDFQSFAGRFCRAFHPVDPSAPELETLLDRSSPSG